MTIYPYDDTVQPDEEKLMELCFALAQQLMGAYEPFGQSGASYGRGEEERTALGIRTFLSTEGNIQMLHSIGKDALERLKTLARLGEYHREYFLRYGTYSQRENAGTLRHWDSVKLVLEKVDPRTLGVLMDVAREYVKEAIAAEEGAEKREWILTYNENAIQAAYIADYLDGGKLLDSGLRVVRVPDVLGYEYNRAIIRKGSKEEDVMGELLDNRWTSVLCFFNERESKAPGSMGAVVAPKEE